MLPIVAAKAFLQQSQDFCVNNQGMCPLSTELAHKCLTGSLLPLMNWKTVHFLPLQIWASSALWEIMSCFPYLCPLHHPTPFNSPLCIIKKTKACFAFRKVFLTPKTYHFIFPVALCHSDRRFRYVWKLQGLTDKSFYSQMKWGLPFSS